MTRLGLTFAFLGAFAALQAGCGENCQSTCDHIYSESECDVRELGRTADRSIRDCVARCENALQQVGDLGDYDPYVKRPATEKVELENEKQAAAWIDCVWDFAPQQGPSAGCVDIDPATGGYCAPI